MRPDARGGPAGGGGRGRKVPRVERGGVRGLRSRWVRVRCPRGPRRALGRRKPGAPLSRPGSGRGARYPRGGSSSAGVAAAKVSRRSHGRPSLPGPGRGD